MDDLDVIRLAVMENISKERIARGRNESEGESLERGGGYVKACRLTSLQVFPQYLGTVFQEKHLSCEKDAEGEDSR
jgi:hypothetical protein